MVTCYQIKIIIIFIGLIEFSEIKHDLLGVYRYYVKV